MTTAGAERGRSSSTGLPDVGGYELVIIGAGAAGLGAAVHAAADGIMPLVVESGPLGGHARAMQLVETVAGFPVGLSGDELSLRAADRARRFGAEIIRGQVTALSSCGGGVRLTLQDRSITARAAIVASGVVHAAAAVPGMAALSGAGVYYGIRPEDDALLAGEDVFVIGDAQQAAGAGVRRLCRCCRRVTLLTPLGASAAGAEAAEVHDAELIGVEGVASLEVVRVRNRVTGRILTRSARSIFVLDPGTPRTAFLSADVALDPAGFILTGIAAGADWSFGTSAPGVFAAGGVRSGATHRVASALEEGVLAAREARAFLRQRSGRRRVG